MKALSVRQPYASQIVAGKKRVEYRSWETSYRGRLWIHASSRGEGSGLPRGGIIGSVIVYACVPCGGLWAWRLRDPCPCRFVSCRGQCRIFNV